MLLRVENRVLYCLLAPRDFVPSKNSGIFINSLLPTPVFNLLSIKFNKQFYVTLWLLKGSEPGLLPLRQVICM